MPARRFAEFKTKVNRWIFIIHCIHLFHPVERFNPRLYHLGFTWLGAEAFYQFFFLLDFSLLIFELVSLDFFSQSFFLLIKAIVARIHIQLALSGLNRFINNPIQE